jgi:hypothetical protein
MEMEMGRTRSGTLTWNLDSTVVEYLLQSRELLVIIGSPSHFFKNRIGESGIRF